MSTNPAGVAFIALSIPTPFEGASFQEFLVWKLINGTDEGDEGMTHSNIDIFLKKGSSSLPAELNLPTHSFEL